MRLSELNTEPRMVRRIREFCEHAPDGEVFTSQDVATAIGVTTIRSWASDRRLRKFRVDIQRRTWWGSAATIKRA